MLVACIGLYDERVEQALNGINKLRPYVDRYVVIVDDTVGQVEIDVLKNAGCEVYFEPWTDSMVKMRNAYLSKVQTNDWAIVHDPDESFNDQFCKDVRGICKKAEEQHIDLLLINSHDVQYNADGTKQEGISDFFKNLIFRNREGTHYVGVGETEVHEQLDIPGITSATRLPKEKYWYEHVKYWHEVWERAARNVFMGGGGNNVGTQNPSWRSLRDICNNIGINTWTKAREYFRAGNIDPRLKEWLWENRYEGFDYDHEEMEFGRWYFEYLHPEERGAWSPVKDLREGTPPEVMRYVEETYMKVLGRHADQQGKEYYTLAILEGKLKREQLPDVLKRSDEYMKKEAASMESVKIPVPVNVDVKLSEDFIVKALMRSNLYWNEIKPQLDLGKFLRNCIGDDRWKAFQDWFYSSEPDFEKFVKKLKEMV